MRLVRWVALFAVLSAMAFLQLSMLSKMAENGWYEGSIAPTVTLAYSVISALLLLTVGSAAYDSAKEVEFIDWPLEKGVAVWLALFFVWKAYDATQMSVPEQTTVSVLYAGLAISFFALGSFDAIARRVREVVYTWRGSR